VREGILPDYPNSRAPQFDFTNGQLVVPHPPTSREDIQEAPQFDFTNGQLVVPHPPTSREEIQEPFVREQQIDPAEYYPAGYMPELLEDWPVDGDLVVPVEDLPESLLQSMGEAWRLRVKNQKALEEQGKE